MLGSMVLEMPPRTGDKEIRERIAGWLEYHRLENGWSQAALARQMKTSEVNVSRLLKGGRGAGLELLSLVRKNLHLNLNIIFDGPAPALPKERRLRPLISPRSDTDPVSISSRPPATRSGSTR